MDNVKAIKNFPTPNNVKSLQRFLGKVNYYHRFIPNAPKLLSPLYALLKKNSIFVWDQKCEETFKRIKTYLTEFPILHIYNPNKELYLYTDASKRDWSRIKANTR